MVRAATRARSVATAAGKSGPSGRPWKGRGVTHDGRRRTCARSSSTSRALFIPGAVAVRTGTVLRQTATACGGPCAARPRSPAPAPPNGPSRAPSPRARRAHNKALARTLQLQLTPSSASAHLLGTNLDLACTKHLPTAAPPRPVSPVPKAHSTLNSGAPDPNASSHNTRTHSTWASPASLLSPLTHSAVQDGI